MNTEIKNLNLCKIFDIMGRFSKDSRIGPCSKSTYNDFAFGFKPLPNRVLDLDNKSRGKHGGWIGWEFPHFQQMFSKEATNAYQVEVEYCNFNYDEKCIKYWKNEQDRMYEAYMKPLFREMYDMASIEHVHQAEFGRRLGIPATFSGGEKDRIIAEFIFRCEISGLLQSKKIRGKRYIYPGDPEKIPENCYELEFKMSKNSSKNEAYVRAILSSIDSIIPKWQVRLPEFKNAPYDFGIYDLENNLIGLIEVQGEQHYRRIKYFHKTEEDFTKRRKIDRKKKSIALTSGFEFLTISEKEIKHKNAKNNIRNKISNCFC